MRTATLSLLLTAVIAAACSLPAQGPVHLSVDPAVRVAKVSPRLYGLMTEEINYSYDGGLYAEMVRNRTFARDWSGFRNWSVAQEGSGRASMSQGDSGPSAALPKSVKLLVASASPGNEAGILNQGYWGMAVRPRTTYAGSFYASSTDLSSAHVSLIADATGATLAETRVPLSGKAGWQRYSFSLTTVAGVEGKGNHLALTFDRPGTVLLQLLSLFPPTFHDRPNGNRPDLMEKMAAMQPQFLRLPGGNYLEGDSFKDRFDWKETLGPLVDRPTHHGPWNYVSTDGIGLLEFLEWCEDLKVEPVLAVFAGYVLKGEHVTGPQLEPYIQDALNELEYVTGAPDTKWGAVRASNGHPAPFALRYVEIGNEDDLDRSGSYEQRFPAMAAAIHARYPQLKLDCDHTGKERRRAAGPRRRSLLQVAGRVL